MQKERVIGKVTATERNPNTSDKVRFWVQREEIVRAGDVVRIRHLSKTGKGPSSYTYALIEGLEYATDSPSDLANYISSDFGDTLAEPRNERIGATIAEAQVLYNDQDVEMPVRDGEPVEWADAQGIRTALGLSGFREPIPAGYMCTSNGETVPIELEADYLIGPEGAHLNISGISGLATKTSYAMFLINALQQKMGQKVSTVIFNVKGSDLLSLDEIDEHADSSLKSDWERCGLLFKPLDNVTYLYPYSSQQSAHGYTQSRVPQETLNGQIQRHCAFNYIYDVEYTLPKLDLIFSDIEDQNSTMASIYHDVSSLSANTWPLFIKLIKDRTNKGSSDAKGAIAVQSWRKFFRLLEGRIGNELFASRSQTLVQQRRQVNVREALAKLRPGTVLVIDIEPLPDYLQCLVVGDVVQLLAEAKVGGIEEIEPSALGTVVLFADELNKYAPAGRAEKDRSLTQSLLDIAERGRSLGLVLFSAEQFRSGVFDRVLGNCSTNVFGRTNPVELSKCPDYRWFPATYQMAATRLPKGQLLLQHAVFKTSLIRTHFPRPWYKTDRAR